MLYSYTHSGRGKIIKSRTINEDPLDLSSGAGSIILNVGSSTNEMGTQKSFF